ncbi:MAG: ATP-binding cassette domain-containing protein [Arachnia sp.]
MLQLHDVRKSYTTADFTQVALDDVSISFRDNEFVAVLGPSGSGKTTLLNIVGGLDHADAGSLEIDGIDTSEYRDRDWDTYRNNRIGFVFQSYNLIPHQSILANVELALTLSGIQRAERRQRAMDALDRVGLKDHAAKRPSQLSGGQMQRVAIARALINDPEILLADEPTGALDSVTSVQIMGLLTEIANDRLVIMVTHNPELAEQYATRTVSLRDGKVAADTDPFLPAEDSESDKPPRRTSMSLWTALTLSFNNLMTKKGRTLMTSFAGSIGIIGIAAILALANGVAAYIQSVEEETLSLYPLNIQSQGLDMTSLLMATADLGDEVGGNSEAGEHTSGQVREVQMMSRYFSSVGANDLASLKKYLDGNGGNVDEYVNSIQYSYNVVPQIYKKLNAGGVRQVNPDNTFAALGLGGGSSQSSLVSSSLGFNVFHELMDDRALFEDQYDVIAGDWPKAADEVVLVLTESGSMSDFVFYAMDLRDPAELEAMVRQLAEDEPIVTPEAGPLSVSYEEILDVTFSLVPASSYFVYEEGYGVWTDKSGDKAFVEGLVAEGVEIHISGIVQPSEDSSTNALQPGLYYTTDMVHQLVAEATASNIVQSQLDQPAVNVFSGRTFADEAANPETQDFDMTSLFSIDDQAITDAFTIDESQLTIDPSSLNLTMPELELDAASLPAMDLTSAMSGVELDLELDLESALAEVDVSNVDLGINGEQATELASGLLLGYTGYCATGQDCTDPVASFQAYLAAPETQGFLTEMEPTLVELEQGVDVAVTDITNQLSSVIAAEVQQGVEASSAALQAQLESAMTQYMSEAMAGIGEQLQAQLGTALEQQIGAAMEQAMGDLAANMSDAMNIDEDTFMEAFEFNFDEQELTDLLMSMMGGEQASYDANLVRLGYADFTDPSAISIYPKDFVAKAEIVQLLDDYNADRRAEGAEDQVITYSDLVGTLMSSVTDIINMISYVLVAFVSISLIVSSIMIGVITYISVLERKKEIGILRSIGASKRDIRRVFNAETLIVGFVAGVIGIGATVLLTIPTNAIVSAQFDVDQVAVLPWQAALILIAVSMGLTFLAGLIPSSAASRRDPVEALRSE